MPPEIARSMVNFGARGRDSLSNPVHVRFGSLADIAVQKGMSALPPIATSIAFLGMTALGQ